MDYVVNQDMMVSKTEIVQLVKPGLEALPPHVQEKKEKEAILKLLKNKGVLCNIDQIEKKDFLIEGHHHKGYLIPTLGYGFVIKKVRRPGEPHVGPKQFEVQMFDLN